MFDQPIVTQIEDAGPFYPAEPEHQQFYAKNPRRYAAEHAQRQEFVDAHWKEHK